MAKDKSFIAVRLRVPVDVHCGVLNHVVKQKVQGVTGASMEKAYIQAVKSTFQPVQPVQ